MKKEKTILDVDDISVENYEFFKSIFPKNTVLNGRIIKLIDEVDPTFRKRYSCFFDDKDPRIDNTSVDGILDWLYGTRYFLPKNSKEYRTFSKVIRNIEKHEIGGKRK